jgi:hypothetical protein
VSYQISFSKKPFEFFSLQPAPAWLTILGFVLITALCLVAGGGGAKVLRFAFPLGSFLVGVFLYLRYPVFYISFTWWMWFLTPMVTRIVDLHGGWDPQRVILLSPFLVTLVTFYTLVRYLPRANKLGALPFVLPIIAVFYAFLIGIILNPPMVAIRSLFDWITPILFAFHLFVNWKDYPQISQNIQRTFFWFVLIGGLYGVCQYWLAPLWDANWIIMTDLLTNGKPERFGIRVFSTMHSPLPFSITMMAGLLLLFINFKASSIPVAVVGYLSLLLTSVRTAWGGWFIGFVTLIIFLNARLQMRIIIAIIAIAVFVTPLVSIEPFASLIGTRFQTFASIQNDASANDRLGTYNQNFFQAINDGVGKGLGGTLTVLDNGKIVSIAFDSGVLDAVYILGWLGGILYLGGILLFLLTIIQNFQERLDEFAIASRAISLGALSQVLLGSVMIGPSGMVLWCFLAMYFAGRKYYQYQRPTF